jgi:hypothetical protein
LSAQGNKVGQPASLQVGLDHSAQFGLAGALIHKGKQLDHDAAGAPLALFGQLRLEDLRITADLSR